MHIVTDSFKLTLDDRQFELVKLDTEDEDDSWVHTKGGDAASARLTLRSHTQSVKVFLNSIDIGRISKQNKEMLEQLHELVTTWIREVGPLDHETARVAELLFHKEAIKLVHQVSVQAITWNVNGLLDKAEADVWSMLDASHDVIFLGFQETDPLSRNVRSNPATLLRTVTALEEKMPEHTLMAKSQLIGLAAVLLVKDVLVPFVSKVSTSSSSTGFMGMWGNKGALLHRFLLHTDEIMGEGTEFSFVNCHLSAGEGSSQVRRHRWELREISQKFKIPGLSLNVEEQEYEAVAQDFEELVFDEEPLRYRSERIRHNPYAIVEESGSDEEETEDDNQTLMAKEKRVRFSNVVEYEKPKEHVEEFDDKLDAGTTHAVIVLGDLNYRVVLDDGRIKELVQAREYAAVLEHDSLRQEIKAGHILKDFKEGSIGFPPTYKFALGTNKYVTRVPSYTDRVFYRASCPVDILSYQSISNSMSDHRPVGASLKVGVNGFDLDQRGTLVDKALWAVDQAVNNARPKLSVDNQVIDLEGSVLSTISAWIVLNSEDDRAVRWTVQHGPHIQVTPSSGILIRNNKVMRILVKGALHVGVKNLQDVLVIKPSGGSDIFVSVDFRALPSCLGHSLDEMCYMVKGARNPLSEEPTTNMPKQIWECINYLWSRIDPDMFSEPGEPSLIQKILEWLDTGVEFDIEVLDAASAVSQHAGIKAVASVLLLIMRYLPETPIKIEDVPSGKASSVLEKLSSVEANVVIYISSFFRHALDFELDKQEAIDILESLLISPGGQTKERKQFVASLLLDN